jgi:hypothetical protein
LPTTTLDAGHVFDLSRVTPPIAAKAARLVEDPRTRLEHRGPVFAIVHVPGDSACRTVTVALDNGLLRFTCPCPQAPHRPCAHACAAIVVANLHNA